MRDRFLLTSIIGIVLGVGLIAISFHQGAWSSRLDPFQGGVEYRPEGGGKPIVVNLLDPEMAPENIRPLVTRGFQVMMATKAHCGDHCGNVLNCTNCHFCGGATMGGRNGGISLVGVSKVYPRTMPNGKKMSLEERVNGCFLRSLNGRALPQGSPHMEAMLAYLDWISQGVGEVPEESWLGLKDLKSDHVPDLDKGRQIFAQECAKCHGPNGEGQTRSYDLSYPPLWGNQSFNSAAGMNKLPTIASFVYYNMPYQDPHLTVEQALDVAAFVRSQARPHIRSTVPQKAQKQLENKNN